MGAEPLSRRSRQGELLGGKYMLEERLGSGGMGDVSPAKGDAVARGVALGFLALGGLVAVRGWRLTPRSTSYFIAAAGTVALGGVLLVMGPAAAQATSWAAALVALGAAAVALRHATDDWLAELRSSAIVLVIVSTGALFAAAQLVRGQP